MAGVLEPNEYAEWVVGVHRSGILEISRFAECQWAAQSQVR
jgi:hypothetical protein